MAQDKDRQRGDFLSMMLNDDLFRDKEDYLVDECLTHINLKKVISFMSHLYGRGNHDIHSAYQQRHLLPDLRHRTTR